MVQKGFYYDMSSCIGCKACQIACKDKNDLDVESFFRKVYDFEGGKFPNPWKYYISMACNHCDIPKCVENCPTGASYKSKEDGLVIIDPDKCIGCQYCIWSCPYKARQYSKQLGKVGKCDGCQELLGKGEQPACVASCVMRVLDFGPIEELKRKYIDTVKDLDTLPDSNVTEPNVLIKPDKNAYKRRAL